MFMLFFCFYKIINVYKYTPSYKYTKSVGLLNNINNLHNNYNITTMNNSNDDINKLINDYSIYLQQQRILHP